MRKARVGGIALAGLALLVVAAGAVWAGETEAAGTDAQASFERLKGLEGTWTGTAVGHDMPETEGAKSEFRVSAAGTVVMETMSPGTDHEMINMYHLDGDNLVVTHYCAGGNQPTMKLDAAGSDAERMEFVFTGGTNLDPSKDMHIHDMRIVFNDDGSLISSWTGWANGEPMGDMNFKLSRAE